MLRPTPFLILLVTGQSRLLVETLLVSLTRLTLVKMEVLLGAMSSLMARLLTWTSSMTLLRPHFAQLHSSPILRATCSELTSIPLSSANSPRSTSVHKKSWVLFARAISQLLLRTMDRVYQLSKLLV